ncbi:MAG: amino acid permease [Acidobacteria bacterium]|nr:amino acid permease [Acidobacteriota bacterium]
MVSPRVYYAMAQDGLFFKSFGELHPRFQTPHRATLIQIALASLLILSGTFNEIIGYFFFIVVLFIALSVAGLFRIRKREFDGYKTLFYPVTPVFFLLITSVVLLMIAMKNPLQTIIGTAVVLLGIPVYRMLRNSDL